MAATGASLNGKAASAVKAVNKEASNGTAVLRASVSDTEFLTNALRGVFWVKRIEMLMKFVKIELYFSCDTRFKSS
ncbi:hypothetical protein GCM10027299_43360 [Larkinella ripae]